MPSLAKSLSARLLLLTIVCVMLAEVLVFAPSIARFRLNWMEDRISAAHLATMALEASPTRAITKMLEEELLRHVQGYGVILQKPGSKVLMLSADMPPSVDATVNLENATFFGLIGDALSTLARPKNRVLRVMGPSPIDANIIVTVVLDERPLRDEMIAYGWRILGLSVIISLFTAALVFLSLQWLMVAPMRRITTSMVAFREDPLDPESRVVPSARRDEIGVAERELSTLQTRLRAALRQRESLAALGEAVAKINHDLRNMLATARLVSERMAYSDDPDVKRALPTLERAIDRAVALCTQTLNFAEERNELKFSRFNLVEMLAEVPVAVPVAGTGAGTGDGGTKMVTEIPVDLNVTADRDQLFRVFANLTKNAFEAGATTVTTRLIDEDVDGDGVIGLALSDDGPGMPEKSVEHLFKAFAGSTRAGGTGLGLAIAREVMEAHGGSIDLSETSEGGTVFHLRLPEKN
jgi:signal transduction histidine kinase